MCNFYFILCIFMMKSPESLIPREIINPDKFKEVMQSR